MPLILAPFITLWSVLMLVALAFAIAIIMGYISGALSGLPWPLDKLAGPVGGLADTITHACSVVVSKTESIVGASFHWMARYLEQQWHHDIANTYNDLFGATQLERQAVGIRKISGVASHAASVAGAHDGKVGTLEREFNGIEHRVKTLEREFHGIDETGIAKKLGVLDNELAQIESKAIPQIKAAADQADSAISDLWGWITGVATRPVALTFAGAVAVALGSLGLGGLRCSNFRNLLSKFGCGLGSLLNDLFGLMIAGLALESVCEFLPLLEDAYGAVVGPLTHLLTEVPLGACEQPPISWATLNVAAGPLPPPQSLGPFPS